MKRFNRFLWVGVSLLMFLTIAGFAAPLHAKTILTADEILWVDLFLAGGPGKAGNIVVATDFNSFALGLEQTADAEQVGEVDNSPLWETDYAGIGFFIVKNNPLFTENITATNLNFWEDETSMNFEISGDFTEEDIAYEFQGSWSGQPQPISIGPEDDLGEFGILLEELLGIELPFDELDLITGIGGFPEVTSEANFELNIAQVPEPDTMLLLGIGLIGLAGISRRKLIRKS